MGFETSVYSSMMDASKKTLDFERGLEEAKVRPRELEAATSLAESRATSARSSIELMNRLSKADAEAAKAIQEANAVGDQEKIDQKRIEAYQKGNLWEQAEAVKKKQFENKIAGSDAIVKAAKAQEASNEEYSVTLRGLSDYAPALEFGEASVQKAQREALANPTPENRAKVANALATVSKIRLAQSQGKSWQDTHKEVIEPLADSLSTTAQQHKRVMLEAQNQRAREKNAADIQRAELAALVKQQQIAAQREREVTGKQTRANMEAMKLDQAYSKMEQRLNTEIDKITSEQGEEVDNPDASFWIAGDSKMPNPVLAEKRAQLKALKERHDENMLGLQTAIDSGKTFVPKPYDKGLAPTKEPIATKEAVPQRPANVPAGSQYSPSTKTWWKDGKKVG